MRGVKKTQFKCKKMGSKRMRRETAARNGGQWREGGNSGDLPGMRTQRPVLRSFINPRDWGNEYGDGDMAARNQTAGPLTRSLLSDVQQSTTVS
jgi:hypothetical protein